MRRGRPLSELDKIYDHTMKEKHWQVPYLMLLRAQRVSSEVMSCIITEPSPEDPSDAVIIFAPTPSSICQSPCRGAYCQKLHRRLPRKKSWPSSLMRFRDIGFSWGHGDEKALEKAWKALKSRVPSKWLDLDGKEVVKNESFLKVFGTFDKAPRLASIITWRNPKDVECISQALNLLEIYKMAHFG